jgi:hypothetical protein
MKKVSLVFAVAISAFSLLSFKPVTASEDAMVDLSNYTLNVELVNALLAPEASAETLAHYSTDAVQVVWIGSCKTATLDKLNQQPQLVGSSYYVPYSLAVEMQQLGIISGL